MPTASYQINIPISTTCSNYQASIINEISLKNYIITQQCPVETSEWRCTVSQAYTSSPIENINEALQQFLAYSPYSLITEIKELVVLEKGVSEYILNTDIIPNLLLSILKEINAFTPLFGKSLIYFYKDYEDNNYRQLVLKISVPGSDRERRNAYLLKACNVLSQTINKLKEISLPEQASIIDDFYFLFSIKFTS